VWMLRRMHSVESLYRSILCTVKSFFFCFFVPVAFVYSVGACVKANICKSDGSVESSICTFIIGKVVATSLMCRFESKVWQQLFCVAGLDNFSVHTDLENLWCHTFRLRIIAYKRLNRAQSF